MSCFLGEGNILVCASKKRAKQLKWDLHREGDFSQACKPFFRVGRFYLEDQNSAHGTKVNGEKLHKFSAYKLTYGDIMTFGRSSYYRGVEFKAVIGKISLAYPCFDSLVPSSMDQVPMKEVEGKKVPRMEVPRKEEISISDSINDRTLSLESLIGALEKEENRSPKTDRKLVGLKEALHYKQNCQLNKLSRWFLF